MGTSDIELTRLNDTRRIIESWATFLLAIYIFAVPYALLTTDTKYTYLEPPAAPGDLISERWNYHFVFSLSLALFVFVWWSLYLMINAAHVDWRRNVHVVIVALLMIYFGAMALTWSVDLAHANAATTQNARNPANDPRWCCVNSGLPSSQCHNVPCAGVGQGDLLINPAFLWKYVWTWLFIGAMAMDLVIVLCVYKPRVVEYADSLRDPLLDEGGGAPAPTAPAQQEDEQPAMDAAQRVSSKLIPPIRTYKSSRARK